jgi:hypothetical protein
MVLLYGSETLVKDTKKVTFALKIIIFLLFKH